MNTKKKKIILVLFSCPIALLLFGYISAFLSFHNCEKHLAHTIADEINKSGKEYVITTELTGIKSSANYSNAEKILRSAGIKFRIAPEGAPSPWITVSDARIFLPFINRIEYARMDGMLAGRGETYFYITFFGFIYPIKKRTAWVS
jgi:hypothetical protein